jgi:hypothetical protein
VGLVARFLEEEGFSTVTLTVMPEFNRTVGIPRVAAIEHPFGRPVGNVNDREGQRAVLLETLSVLAQAKIPGEVFHLHFTWPEDPKATLWQPQEPSPIVKMFSGQIKKAGKKEAGQGS